MSRIAPLRKCGMDSLTIEISTFCDVAMISMSCKSDQVLVDRVPPLFAMMRYLPVASASAFFCNILLAFATYDFKFEVNAFAFACHILFVGQAVEPCS